MQSGDREAVMPPFRELKTFVTEDCRNAPGRMTISHINCHTAASVVEKAANLGLEAVHFGVVRDQGRATEGFSQSFQLSDEHLVSLYHQVNALREPYRGRIEISPLLIDEGSCTVWALLIPSAADYMRNTGFHCHPAKS